MERMHARRMTFHFSPQRFFEWLYRQEGARALWSKLLPAFQTIKCGTSIKAQKLRLRGAK